MPRPSQSPWPPGPPRPGAGTAGAAGAGTRTAAEAEPEAEEPGLRGTDALLETVGLGLGDLLVGQRLVDLGELGVADRVGELLAVGAERLGEGGRLRVAAVDDVVEARVELRERVVLELLGDAAVGARAVERCLGRVAQRLLEAVEGLAAVGGDLRERLGAQLREQLARLEAEVVGGGLKSAEHGAAVQARARGVAQVLDGRAELGGVDPRALGDVVEERVAIGADGGAGGPGRAVRFVRGLARSREGDAGPAQHERDAAAGEEKSWTQLHAGQLTTPTCAHPVRPL